jgi:hypothetical protein
MTNLKKVLVLVGVLSSLLFYFPSDSQAWTDSSITGNYTPIRATHIQELRTLINTKRAACGLGAFAWSRSAPVAGDPVRLSDFAEMRTALSQIYTNPANNSMWNTTPNLPSYSYPLQPTTGPDGIVYPPIHAADLTELRNFATAAGCCGDGVCSGPETAVNCPILSGGDCPGPAATCFDLIQNQGETGVDCGGPCAACAVCGDGTCQASETGATCPRDCCSAAVTAGSCINQARADGYNYCVGNLNSPTVGTSNGYAFMPNATLMSACSSASDLCTSQYTCGGQTHYCVNITNSTPETRWSTTPCPAPTCSDGIQNQGETGIDCGGPCGAACPCNAGTMTRDTLDCFGSVASTVASGGSGTSNCSAPCTGTVAGTCSNGFFNLSGTCTPPPCPVNSTLGECPVTMGGTTGTQNGNCVGGCTGGPVFQSCHASGWVTVSGSCNICPGGFQTLPNTCNYNIIPPRSGSKTGLACGAGCTGTVDVTCVAGTWQVTAGSCTPCPATLINNTCTVTMAGVTGNQTGTCGGGTCSGSVNATCSNGAWIVTSGACNP